MARPKTSKTVQSPTFSATDPAGDMPEMASEDMIRYIMNKCAQDPKRGVPTLIGPTQWGKTYFTNHWVSEWAKSIGKDFVLRYDTKENEFTVIPVNPQNDLPEDLSGWPMRDGNVLRFTQPSVFPPSCLTHNRWAMFVDELDKARDETWSSLLTLFSTDERRLRHTRIPEGVPIMAAMNEPNGRTMPDPLLARLLFISYPPQGLKVWERPDLKPLENLARQLFSKVPDVGFPTRPSAPGSLHKLILWLQDAEFWNYPNLRAMIVRGLFNDKDAAVAMTSLEEQPPMRSAEEWATHVTPIAFAAQVFDVFSTMNYEDGEKILKIIIDRANADPTKELERVFRVFAENPEVMRAVNRKELAAEGRQKLADLYATELPKILGEKATAPKK